MENRSGYKSAWKYAVAYTNGKNNDKLEKYGKILKDAGYDYKDNVNLQNMIMFAGALVDEKMGFDEKTTKEMVTNRKYWQETVEVSQQNYEVVRQILQDMCNALIKEDRVYHRENIDHYKDVYKDCKQFLSETLDKEAEKTLNDFIKVL